MLRKGCSLPRYLYQYTKPRGEGNLGRDLNVSRMRQALEPQMHTDHAPGLLRRLIRVYP